VAPSSTSVGRKPEQKVPAKAGTRVKVWNRFLYLVPEKDFARFLISRKIATQDSPTLRAPAKMTAEMRTRKLDGPVLVAKVVDGT